MEITERHIDALKELINIGVGKGASILNTMLSSHIALQVPEIQITNIKELTDKLIASDIGKVSTVILKFKGPFAGSAELMFPSKTAMTLVNTLVGDNIVGMDFDSIRSGTLCEIGNVVLNGVMGSFGNILSKRFKYTVPEFVEDTPDVIFSNKAVNKEAKILLAKTKFIIKELNIDGDIIIFFDFGGLDKLVEMIEVLENGN